MVMIMSAALSLVIMVVVLMVMSMSAALSLVIMMMILMVMSMSATLSLVIMVVVLMVVMAALFFPGVFQHFLHHFIQGISTLYGFQHDTALQRIKGRCNNGSAGIMFTDQSDTFLNFIFSNLIRSTQNNCARILYLIDKKLPKVFYIHFCLGGVHHRHRTVYLHIQICRHIFNSFQHIGKFSHP